MGTNNHDESQEIKESIKPNELFEVFKIQTLPLEEQLKRRPDSKYVLFVVNHPILRKGYVVYDVRFEGGDRGPSRVLGLAKNGDIMIGFPGEWNWELFNREMLELTTFDVKKWLDENKPKEVSIQKELSVGQYV